MEADALDATPCAAGSARMKISSAANYGAINLLSDLTVKDACVIVDQSIDDPMRDLVGRVTRYMIDTREKQIREGLIKLGWTPPPSTT
jgi:hypothetical protein